MFANNNGTYANESTTTAILTTTATATTTTTTTTERHNVSEKFEEASPVVVPLVMFSAILLLSAVVYLMARHRRLPSNPYCKHRRMHSAVLDEDSDRAPLERGVDDFDNDNDDPTECLLKGRLHIDNSYHTYKSTQSTNSFADRRELST